MSLSGSVEDLPLLEILQVVAFCQKTGHLTVEAPEGEAAVVFSEGRVVSGYVWDVPPLDSDAAPPSGEPARSSFAQRITSILAAARASARGRVRLQRGLDHAPTQLGGRDLSGETLDDGINPEGLMLDLARQLDEDRRESSAAIEASFAGAPPGSAVEAESLEELALEEAARRSAGESAPTGPSVLLVDDEPEVRRLVGERLLAAGFEVVEAADARRRPARGRPPGPGRAGPSCW